MDSPRRRILFLTPQLPYPPHQGTAIRNWHILRHVAAHHTVDVLSFAANPPADLAAAGPLRDLVGRLDALPAPPRPLYRRLADMAAGHADMARRLHSDAFAARLAEWLADGYDVVQAEGIEMAPYLWPTSGPLPLAARLVYDAHNAEALLQQRNWLTDARQPRRWAAAAYSWVQWQRLSALEADLLRRADGIIAVSETDAATLRALAPGLSPLVVPNGVDTAFYDPALADAQQPVPLAADTPWLVFTGKLDYRPNIEASLWLVGDVMPRVWAAAPAVRVALVGRDPAPSVRALAGPRVTVTGWVPDTRPYIAAAALFVAPLRVGGGTRLKLLEALAMARPIVSTSRGAEGLDLGAAAMLADDADAFATAVLALLADPPHRAAMSGAARQLAVARYDWQAILPRLDGLYA